ncbi:LysR family transcriptional regulator [Billgrantia diversa]|uniref:LysR family transcriptional regulator n=1 Tax=Halomonas sp. MCCC 1A13316 TaxID=2733487 RepID=UPI0018A34E05|nr:LysR family transcriptional regulator [Halomonas sp. MCCC 1A13316]QOR37743.1 LysR family transcriptional regulator [Halomonas sp. MCCC 1A13316]
MSQDQLLDTHLLHLFVTIAESDSLSDAAARLHITQPAISQGLRQLEERLGTQLVVRRTRPVKLTIAGTVLRQNAASILGELRRLNALVRDSADKGLVQCRLGMITSLSEVFGSQLFGQLREQVERLTLRSGLTNQLRNAFLNRETDILISNDPLDGIEQLERFRLLRDPMLVAIPNNLISSAVVNLQSLSTGSPLIKYGRANDIGIYTEVVLRRMGLVAKVNYETDDTHTLMRFIQDGHGWGILSALCLAQSLHRLEGTSLHPLDNSRHYRSIYLIARQGEMGRLPALMAETIQELFHSEIYPQLKTAAPWMSAEEFQLSS